jgi:hypothetical protein
MEAHMRIALLWTAIVVGLVCVTGQAWADGSCSYGDAEYLNGSAVCRDGTQYRCEDGAWRWLNVFCAGQTGPSKQLCAYEGQYYAAGIVNCQSSGPEAGTQQRCEDGEWKNLRLPCAIRNGAVEMPRSARGCPYEGAEFQPQAVMCKDRAALLCDGGRWIDLGTACP